MRIGGKLTTGFFIVALFTGVIGYFGVRVTDSIDHEFNHVATDTLPDIEILKDLRFAGVRIVSSTMEYAFLFREKKGTHDENGQEADEKEQLESGVVQLEKAVSRYELLAKEELSEEKELIKRVKGETEKLRDASRAFIALVQGGASGEKLLHQREEFEDTEKSFLKAVDNALIKEHKKFAKNKESAGKVIVKARNTIRTATVSVFAFALFLGAMISGSLARRLRNLKEAAVKIGAGDLDVVIPVKADDEVGGLAAAFNGMAGDLKKSRDEIVAAKNYLNNIIHSMIDSLIVVAPDGTIQSVNVATCSMLGYDEEPVGQSFTTILPESPLAELIEKGIVRNVEKTYVTQDGRCIPVAFSGSVMWNDDNTLQGFVCLALDITERKRAEERLRRYSEELQESNEELKDFAYIVSHDLRAPLVNIKGFSAELSDLLKELETTFAVVPHHIEECTRARILSIFQTEVPEAISFITSSVSRMDNLINGILKLSRMGRRDLTPERINTGEMVSDILKSLGHQLEQRQVTVTVGALPEVDADRTAMEQIFGNLLDNSVKYMEPGRPGALEIRGETKGGGITFHIRDNGRGIARDDMDKLFDIFRRVGRQDVPGEGLGLAYVRTLIRRLGGHIWCESEPGVGSTFSFTVLSSRDTVSTAP